MTRDLTNRFKPQFIFRIEGNQEDPGRGNAIPKVKLTGRQQWTKSAQRYKYWKQYVQAALLHLYYKNGHSPVYRTMLKNIALWKKPIVLGKDQIARMDIVICWDNEKHADPESVFGSIADTLFEDDKHLAGSFEFMHSRGQAWVDVSIWISQPNDQNTSSMPTIGMANASAP